MRLSGIGSQNHNGLNDRRTKENIKQALISEFGFDANGNALVDFLCRYSHRAHKLDQITNISFRSY